MKITVKTVDAASAEIEVTEETTVRELKLKISKAMSIPALRQRLIHQGNLLRVSKNTMSDYSIVEGAEVQLVLEAPPPEEKVGALPQVPSDEVEGEGEGGEEGATAVGGQVDPTELSEEQKKKDEEHEKEVKDREKRNMKDIHRHVKNTKKCIEWATKILDRYQKVEAKRAEWKRAREAGEDLMEMDQEDDPDEKPETRRRRFPWQDEDNEPILPPIERSEFASLMKDLQAVQDRARPMLDQYYTMVTTDPNLEVEAGLQAERVAQTVKEFNYYIGHAMISISRLQMIMNTPPPRNVKLAPTRRTEMRRVMRDLRNMPPRAPSGYIVDIQRDGGPTPKGTRNAPAPTDPLTSVALGSKDKKKKKKDEDKKDDEEGPGEGATGTGPAANADQQKEGESGGGEGQATDDAMEQGGGGEGGGGEGEGAKEAAEAAEGEEEPKKERTRDVLAKLLTGMVSGMMGTDEEEEEEEGEGKEKGGKETQKEGKEEKKDPKKGEKSEEEEEEEEEEEDEDKDDEDDDDDPKKTFAEKYVGPPGSIVTIQSIPQPPFGIPTMNPQPGPSLCIRNTGDPNKPDVKVNFPMPPALQMLQDLLGGDSSSDEEVADKQESDMSAEDKEKRRRKDRKKMEREKKQKEREERIKKKDQEEKEEKEKEQRLRRAGRETKAFTPKEEAEIAELSDAGSVDSLDSRHDYLEAHHVDNPMVRLAMSAMWEIEGGIRLTVHDSMVELYTNMGQPPPAEEVSEEEGMMEMLMEALSKPLSVLETMTLMWGVEEPMKKLQPCLYQFIRDKLLKGEEPTSETKKKAVNKILSNFISSVASTMITIFPKEGVDLPRTLYHFLQGAVEEVYDVIVTKHKDEAAFAKQLHAWGTKTSLLFAGLLHHMSRNDDLYEDAAKQLFTVFLPGETPAMAMTYPYSALDRELKRMKTAHNYTAEELEKKVIYKRGRGPGSQAKPKDDSDAGGKEGGASDDTDSAPTQQPPPASDPKEPPPASDPEDPKPEEGEQKEGQPPPSDQKEEGEEWVPAIKRDREALARMRPQQPLSDAYVSGMPPKRRKLEAEGCGEVGTGGEFLGKSLQSAINKSGATPTSGVTVDAVVNEAEGSTGLAEGLEQELQLGVKERLEGDPDFNSQQFPSADKVYQPSK